MIRVIFYSILAFLLVRALSRFWNGVIAGVNGPQPPRGSHVPQRGVQMARDPICGTFVVPQRSIVLAQGGETLYFCSTTCRDRYLAHGSSGGRRAESVSGRSA